MKTVNVTPRTWVNDGLSDTFIFKTVVRMEKDDVKILQRALKKVAACGVADETAREYIKSIHNLRIFGPPDGVEQKKIGKVKSNVEIKWSTTEANKIFLKSATILEYCLHLISDAQNKTSNKEWKIRMTDNQALEKSGKFFANIDRENVISAVDKKVFEKSAEFFANLQ